jgi:hypothetical protein
MTKKILDREIEEDKFQTFLVEIDDIIDEFIEEAERFGFDFDFSEYSLDMLENYYLRREPELDKDEKRKGAFIEAAACYLGETLIKHYGGAWTLAIDDPKDLYYGMPVITGHSKYDIEFCPHEKIRMFVRQKKMGFLRRVILNHINPIDDLADLVPETE